MEKEAYGRNKMVIQSVDIPPTLIFGVLFVSLLSPPSPQLWGPLTSLNHLLALLPLPNLCRQFLFLFLSLVCEFYMFLGHHFKVGKSCKGTISTKSIHALCIQICLLLMFDRLCFVSPPPPPCFVF